MTPEQVDFLKNHSQAVLATGRKDGSPQCSTVMYQFDGTDMVMSIKSFTAKWHNALRQPKVCLVVNDGRTQMVVYGTAEGFAGDPDRRELSKRIPILKMMIENQEMADEQLSQLLDAQDRTVLRVMPDKVLFND